MIEKMGDVEEQQGFVTRHDRHYSTQERLHGRVSVAYIP